MPGTTAPTTSLHESPGVVYDIGRSASVADFNALTTSFTEKWSQGNPRRSPREPLRSAVEGPRQRRGRDNRNEGGCDSSPSRRSRPTPNTALRRCAHRPSVRTDQSLTLRSSAVNSGSTSVTMAAAFNSQSLRFPAPPRTISALTDVEPDARSLSNHSCRFAALPSVLRAEYFATSRP